MFEAEFLKFISKRCSFINIYFLNAPRNKKTPYGVLYPASTAYEGAGGCSERVETIYRLDIYGINKESSLDVGYTVKEQIDKYRGQIGAFKDVFIRCQYPNILDFGDGTYKTLLEINTQYINGGQK